MDDNQILSAFQDLTPAAPPPPAAAVRTPAPVLVFDACRVGVVLRAVLFVEAVVAVAAMFAASHLLEWLGWLSVLTGVSLPATLAWLLLACSLKRLLARLPSWAQAAFGVGLGMAAGLYACGLLVLTGFVASRPWLACASAGGLLAALLVAALVLRARGHVPADTAARLAELQARIQPHFLFNTLNSAIALVRLDPARAEALLEDLGDLFRHALTDPGDSVTLAEEIELARRYLDIEKVRFGERLRVEWAIDPQAGSARVPLLTLQPLVENAVKHGVEPSEQGAEIKISTQCRGSTVVVKVTNTVPAGQGHPGHGVAQKNVRERLDLLHDMQARFQSLLKDGIYQVRLEVPA